MPTSLTLLLSSYYLPYQQKSALADLQLFSASTAPKITISQYLDRLLEYFKCSDECFIVSLIYIQRISSYVEINQFNIHRVLLVSLVISVKFFNDFYYANSYYAQVGGISNHELNSLEAQFLQIIQYKLMVSTQEFEQYKLELIRIDAEKLIDDSIN